MIVFYTISSVRKDIEKFQGNKAYGKCCQDLCSLFAGKTIDDIFNQPRALKEHNRMRYIKSRINNSNNGRGASSGYRVYYYVDLEKELVTIVKFYPKVGKYGQINMTPTEEKEVIAEYRAERDNNLLVSHSITRNFSLQEAF